jgi:predicted metalloprotease
VRFNPKARLDRSQVQVRRGGGRSGGGMPIPIPASAGGRIGGGIGGLVILVIVLFLSGALTGGGGGAGGSGNGVDASQVEGVDNCQTGEDANSNEQCALVADVNSIQAFWGDNLEKLGGPGYQESTTVLFSGSVDTGCGGATSDVGPFYCPVDKTVYLDSTFFRDMLEGQLGAKGGSFAEAYVLAHEYGHHVQDLLGTMSKVRTQQGATSDAVRLELQADCYAGIWAKNATTVENDDGQVLILDLTDEDIARAIDSARAVGDDRIQQQSSGRVNPDKWTHGSAGARVYWFQTGMREGTLEACDTFSADDLHL